MAVVEPVEPWVTEASKEAHRQDVDLQGNSGLQGNQDTDDAPQAGSGTTARLLTYHRCQFSVW